MLTIHLIKRPSLAGAVLQVPDPFPQDIQITFSLSLWELETWHFESMFTSHHVLHVVCYVILYYMVCLPEPIITFKIGDGENFTLKKYNELW